VQAGECALPNARNMMPCCREQKRTSEALKEEVQALQLAILKQVLESPGCVPLSELLLADLSNPTPATLQHLQQLAFLATQQQGASHTTCWCLLCETAAWLCLAPATDCNCRLALLDWSLTW
jgi:hypothetical protein